VFHVDSKYFQRTKGNFQPQTGIPTKSLKFTVSNNVIIGHIRTNTAYPTPIEDTSPVSHMNGSPL